ncbi:transcription termination factor, mitochondrial [Lutzomyia longipalpis]|uniref:transcription termination factor, mitochondrial n=1 Tax=Lutzomyia longipalpis TaxID=7200 RepID=UPI002483D475|nr:transcription termination factor, mitochondrial [Lutzomyia longipalpis]
MLPIVLKISRITPKVTSMPRIVRLLASSRSLGTFQPVQGVQGIDDISDPTIGQNFEDFSLRKSNKLYVIQSKLKCTEEEATKMLKWSKEIQATDYKEISENLTILLNHEVTPACILENPWLLVEKKATIRQKIFSLNDMEPKQLRDFVPLLRISLINLMKLQQRYKQESSHIPHKHRVYYLSNQLEIEPRIVSKYLSLRQFIFYLPFSKLHASISLLRKYNVAPMNILKDIWVLRYNADLIQERLDYVKKVEVKRTMPWMVRCPDSILDNSLKITQENRAILGRNETALEYLCERLGYDQQTMMYIMSKHPAALRVRVTKIKEILDYLLIEAGFSPQDIAQVPRILCHSLETTRSRLNELKNHGCTPSTLTIVCKSQREYEKFVNNWLSCREKIKIKEKLDSL